MERMSIAKARELNAKGQLTRKVMTEEGWYIPSPPVESVEPVAVPVSAIALPGDLPPPKVLPPLKVRKTRKAKEL